MEFRILGGPVGVRDGGETIDVSEPLARRLLAVLLAEYGGHVPGDVLRERLGTPDIEQVVSATPAGGRIQSDDHGYRLRLAPDDYLDLREFRELTERARASRESDAASAIVRYERALGLWGDDALADLPPGGRGLLLRERARVRGELAELVPSSGEALSIDTTKASAARIYDYFLDGKDNYAVDRAAAEKIMKAVPEAPASARANRAFLARTVRHLAETGVRQFIDVGAGLPTQGNVHEVAQDADPGARVVYVDNDPVVLVHGRALLEGSPNVAVIEGDVRRPEEILADARLNELIDFGEPVGLLLVALLHFIPDEDDPAGLVARLTGRLAPGSHVVVSHAYAGGMNPDDAERATGVYRESALSVRSRDHTRLAEFLSGLDVLAPGIVWVAEWGRPHAPAQVTAPETSHAIGAVARKP